jgi:2-octaprenyl-6-methoxyphenol hydroxylase
MRKKTELNFDLIIAGAGPAGLVAALLIAASGAKIAVLEQAKRQASAPTNDNRTAALLGPAVKILASIGIDADNLAGTAPLRRLSLVDLGHGPSARPTTVDFAASEINQPYFALNIAQGPLMAALLKQVLRTPTITLIDQCTITALKIGPALATLDTTRGLFTAPLVVGADGKQSPIRRLSGIETVVNDYHQTALTTMVTITKPHHDTSIEFHRPGGPFTLVPMAGKQASIVWLEPTERARAILAQSEAARTKLCQDQSHNRLGTITPIGPWQSWDLSWTRATSLIAPRVALMAEAAHALPPSGAQGLNLSLQDAATLAPLLIKARRLGLDMGSLTILADYARARGPIIAAKSRAVDGLNRLILAEHAGVRRLRRYGLVMAASLPPLRQSLMRFGWRAG